MRRQQVKRRERADPPVISTKASLYAAMWRLRCELDALNWRKLELSPSERDDLRDAWNAILTSLRDGLAKHDGA